MKKKLFKIIIGGHLVLKKLQLVGNYNKFEHFWCIGFNLDKYFKKVIPGIVLKKARSCQRK